MSDIPSEGNSLIDVCNVSIPESCCWLEWDRSVVTGVCSVLAVGTVDCCLSIEASSSGAAILLDAEDWSEDVSGKINQCI